jgi:hypothetical protein
MATFNAPKGYKRLTINLNEEIHNKLKMSAVKENCTATDIIERLLAGELSANSDIETQLGRMNHFADTLSMENAELKVIVAYLERKLEK